MRTIVIGRNYTSLLGMIRPAGLAGCEVIAIRTVKNLASRMKNHNSLSEDPIEKYSRYVTQHFFVEQNVEELINLLLEKCISKEEKSIILPCDDFAASAIDLNQEKLRDHFLFPNINNKQGEIVRYMDKSLQKELAKKVGLNVANGWLIKIHDGKYDIPQDIQYPVFAKPDVSFIISKSFMRKCKDENELRALICGVINKQECPILVEKFIDIENEYGILGVSDGNESVIPGIVKKISIGHGVHNGVTLIGQYSSLSEFGNLKEKLSNLMSMIGFKGLFDIDLYESNGKMYFNELNLRLGAFGFAALRAGINLPQMFIGSLVNNSHVADQEFSGNIKCISEKVNLEDYYNGFITWKEYKENLKQANFGFIQFDDDIAPYRRFCSNVRKVYIKREVKNILHRR